MKNPLESGKPDHMHEIAFGLNVFYYIIMFGEALVLQKKSNLEVSLDGKGVFFSENLIKCRVPSAEY